MCERAAKLEWLARLLLLLLHSVNAWAASFLASSWFMGQITERRDRSLRLIMRNCFAFESRLFALLTLRDKREQHQIIGPLRARGVSICIAVFRLAGRGMRI